VIGNAVHVMRIAPGEIEDVIKSGDSDEPSGSSSALLENHA